MIVREHFEIEQTAVTIISEECYLDIAKDAIFEARSIILSKISQDPFFASTYDPYASFPNDHELIKRMCEASFAANVGPMASVAGAIASFAVEKMAEAGSSYAVVDNGGDIAIVCDRDILIGLYAGDPKIDGISLKITPCDTIIGICSSSGKIGPSVSFGTSGISTVISKNVILADACATALGNLIQSNNTVVMTESVENICNIEGVIGCLAYCDGMIAACGDIPEMVRTCIDDNDITRIMLR